MDERNAYTIHTICRICLNHLENDASYGLFRVPGLAKKLCVCTSLSVEDQDGFPENICTTCYSKLEDLHNFQKMCVDSVQKFNEMVAKNCFTCNTPPINSIDLLNIDRREVDGEEEDHVNFDPLLNTKVEIVESEDHLLNMIENVDKETEEKDNNSSIHSDNDIDDDVDFEVNSSDSDEAMPLARLRKSVRAKTKQKSKRRTAKNETYDSSRSDSSDNDKERIGDNDKASIKPNINCHICHQKFKTVVLYEEHMKQHQDMLPFQCKVESCRKGFTTASGLRLHVDHAHAELSEVHPCTVEGCNQKFPRSRTLTIHMKKEHNIIKEPTKEYPCAACTKVFRCPMALKKHTYRHTGEELPHPCNICGKRFPTNSALKDHLMRHAGVKNHVCPYCGVAKTTRQELNGHVLIHSKEKKFKCELCDHATHNKASLGNHVKVVHMKIKNFACQFCGRTFGKSNACKVHERLHTAENCSECKICGRKFLFEKLLTRHLQMHEKRAANPPKTKSKVKVHAAQSTENEHQQLLNVPSEKPSLEHLPVPVPPKPKNSNRVERVDISQLAGTAVNPIPSVAVPSWSPQIDFSNKEGEHVCPDCGKILNSVSGLKLHYKVVHAKIKDFACRYCPMRFGRSQYLRNHERIHTGEKPFECTICGQCFRQLQVLKTHMKVHNKEPKPPKPPKPQMTRRRRVPTSNRGPKIELNKGKAKNFEEYQDPAAECAAASAALLAKQIEKNENKRKEEAEQRKIQEAASEQLSQLNMLMQLQK